MKLYCISFNVNLNGKNYSATLPRRFEKKKWLFKYKEYLFNLSKKLFNKYLSGTVNFKDITSDNCKMHFPPEIASQLSEDELDVIYCLYVHNYCTSIDINNFITITFGISKN